MERPNQAGFIAGHALTRYAAQRDRLCPKPNTPGFFVSECGTRISEWSLRYTFVKLSHQIGLRAASDAHGLCIHDFRHRFAVNTLRNWYRTGVDVERYLPRLSAYLGHVHVTDTYWYLTATPELMQLAKRQLERALRGVRPRLPSRAFPPCCFFTERLMRQRKASPHTIASYRDTFRLLLSFAARRLKKLPWALNIEDLDTPLLGAFLDHLEHERNNTARSSNTRLAAIHSLCTWLRQRQGQPQDPLFPNARGRQLSHDGLQYLLGKHLATARQHCPSLARKKVTPHVLRHTAAMTLLQNGVDRAVIAL